MWIWRALSVPWSSKATARELLGSPVQCRRVQGKRRPPESTAPALLIPSTGKWRTVKRGKQKFVGYENTETDTDVLAFSQDGPRVELLLQENPFYAESGGQVSDIGEVRGKDWSLRWIPSARTRKALWLAGRLPKSSSRGAACGG